MRSSVYRRSVPRPIEIAAADSRKRLLPGTSHARYQRCVHPIHEVGERNILGGVPAVADYDIPCLHPDRRRGPAAGTPAFLRIVGAHSLQKEREGRLLLGAKRTTVEFAHLETTTPPMTASQSQKPRLGVSEGHLGWELGKEAVSGRVWSGMKKDRSALGRRGKPFLDGGVVVFMLDSD